MRVEPVHACLCACDVRVGRTRPETPHHSSSSDLQSHLHTLKHTLKLSTELYMLENRPLQGAKTDDGGVTRGYALHVFTAHACKNVCGCMVCCKKRVWGG